MFRFRSVSPSALPIIAIAVLAVLFGAGSAIAEHDDEGVTLYVDSGYRGGSRTFTEDVADLGGYGFARNASSVRVAPGCQARLYAYTDYRGPYVEVTSDVPELGRTEVGNDRVQSIEVDCRTTDRLGGNRWRGDGDDRRGRDNRDNNNGWRGDRGRGDRAERDRNDRPATAVVAGPVTLFGDVAFRGDQESFDADVADLGRTRIGNDRASSVRVAGRCTVRLYADTQFRGRWIELDRDLVDLRQSELGNDRASSLRVRCNRWARWGDEGDGHDAPAYRGVTLYRDRDLRGTALTIHTDIADLRRSRIGNDAVTSVAVDPGCRARLYADVGFRGTYLDVTDDVTDLSRTRIGNDRVSSIQVRCGSYASWGARDQSDRYLGEVTLYPDSGYRGYGVAFRGDVSNLRDGGFPNDAASSVRVDPGCTVRLFSDADFRGAHVDLGDDTADLGRTPVGNDRVSSLQVRCR